MEKKIEDQIKALLEQNAWKCNADGRAFVANNLPNLCLAPRNFSANGTMPLAVVAEKVGGCRGGEKYSYPNAQGGVSQAEVCRLDALPENMVNPYLVCFSGMMTAPIFCMEILRFYAKQYGKLLPFLAIGKGGNKGLYESVFNREEGIVIGTEYQAYLNIMELMAPTDYVRAHEKVFQDMDTLGNIKELYRFALEQGDKEITYVLCTGNFSYDKRVLAEWMLELKKEDYKEVKINLVLVHCPIWLSSALPEGHPSEIFLGYVAASLGPLLKDTVPFGSDEVGERYLMPGVAEADWRVFRELISDYSNMGWPNYQELLYGVDHETAVFNIIKSDLYARQSFTAEDYDQAVLQDVECYQSFVGKYTGGDFLEYLKSTPESYFF